MRPIFVSTYNFGWASPYSADEQIRICAEMGYDGIESVHGLTPHISDLLREYNLDIKTGYHGFDREGNITEEEELHKWNITYILAGVGQFYDHDSALRAAEAANRRGHLAAEHGFKVLIHNHTIEFNWDEIEKQYCWETFAQNIDPETVAFQLDAGWAQIAGVDIMVLLKKYGQYVKSMHVKPFTKILRPDTHDETSNAHKKFDITPDGRVDFYSQNNADIVHTEEEKLYKGSQGKMCDCLRSYRDVIELAEQYGCHNFIVERDMVYADDRLQCMRDDLACLRSFG